MDEDIYKKVEALRGKSNLPIEDTDQILSAYINASIANREIGIRNREKIMRRYYDIGFWATVKKWFGIN